MPLPLAHAQRRAAAAVVAATVASALGTLPASAQGDGPDWPQFQGGPEHHGLSVDGPAPPYRLRWTFPAPDGTSLSAAVVVDDLAITVGQRAVYGVDVSNGQSLWEVAREGGPVSAPAVVPGRPRVLLYLDGPDTEEPSPTGTPTDSPTATQTSTATPSASPGGPDTDPQDGSSLVAIDLADRSELWRVPLGAVSRSGVTVDGDAAYVGDQDGTLYSIDVADGTLRWSAEMPGRLDVSIAVADGRAVAVSRTAESRGVLVAAHDVDDGSRLWQVSPQVGSTASSAAALGEGIVVVALADRLVRALGAEDGDERWASLTLQLFSPVTSPALNDDALFVADLGGGLYRFDAEDGDRAWSHQFNEVVLRSSPVVSGDSVLLGLNDGRLVAVDASSGHLVWQSATSPGLLGAIAVSSDAVVAVMGGDERGLVAFEHDPGGRLIDVPSPTELEAGTTLVRFAVAAAIVLAALLVPGMLLRRRFGDAVVVAPDVVEDTEDDG
jgi:outer membrane protein assembly factor BamB